MSFILQKTAIKKLGAVYLDEIKKDGVINLFTGDHVVNISDVLQLGYVPNTELLTKVTDKTFNTAIKAIKSIKGDDVIYKPMYPNFPQQVIEMDTIDLYINAILHYFSSGTWLPEFKELERESLKEDVELTQLGYCDLGDLLDLGKTILSSNDSISDEDKLFVEELWIYTNGDVSWFPEDIPHKENLCFVAGKVLQSGGDITSVLKTSTDVLRLCTYLSEGDVTLATNTRFKNLPRSQRKKITLALEKVISAEDIKRHQNKWIKLFHNLHIGDFSKKVFNIAKTFRSGENVVTNATLVGEALKNKDYEEAVKHLKSRSGEFARLMDKFLREGHTEACEEFLKVADKVSTRVLIQLLGRIKARINQQQDRIIFPLGKGKVPMLITDPVSTEESYISYYKFFMALRNKILLPRLKEEEPLGNCYIDPALNEVLLPTQQRGSSESSFNLARGSRIPFGDKSTLRFFIYWVGQDIDLSATFYDEDFKAKGLVSYTNLRNDKYQACHSGDITSAPNGASEFIDIDVESARNNGGRYVAMNVLVYSGTTFSNHEVCYAGWMGRDSVNSGEIYEPSTVQNKFTLTSNSKNTITALFDLEERKVIWCDLDYKNKSNQGNNVESNEATIQDILKNINNMCKTKVSLGELLTCHAVARGTSVTTPEIADTVFDMSTAKDINNINANFLK